MLHQAYISIGSNIEPEIKSEWLSWMKQIYLPFVMDTKLFFDVKMFRLLDETQNQGFT